MLEIQDLRITRFIAHIVDRESGELELSELETPIDVESGFPHKFFNKYILDALGDEDLRLACFREKRTGKVAAAFDAFRRGEKTFVDASREIAAHLHGVMADSPHARFIKRGDVMVALFQDLAEVRGGGEAPTSMAILKITPSEAILRHTREVDGKRQVFFKEEKRVPAPAEKKEIQKVALISSRRRDDPEPFDLAVLDHQLRDKKVAGFFYRSFLEATLNRDAEEDTSFLLEVTKNTVAAKTLRLDARKKEETLRHVEKVLQEAEKISPQEIVQDLPPKLEKVGKKIVEKLATHRQKDRRIPPDQTIRISTPTAETESKERTYTLDRDVTISGPTDALEDMMTISGPDAQDNYTVCLETKKLEVS